MSIVVKAGAGLAAGVVAGALGLAFLPRLEPNIVRPRSAVEKPQFIVASPSASPSPKPEATLAVATETPVAKASPQRLNENPVSSPSTPVAETVTPAPAPNAAAKPVLTANAEATAPPSPALTKSAPSEAARWNLRGLVALARGDIASARAFLLRAAEAGDARAWVALADAYDPAMLAKFGIVFAPGDAQRARDCLIKAVAAGVIVPKDRLAAADVIDHSVR